MEDAGRTYERGLAYLSAAKKMLPLARRLDEEDRELLRRVADGFVGKGTVLLTNVVRPRRGRRQPAPASDNDRGEAG
jgi:hypothetical protein